MELWAHQARVYDLLKDGKNVILQAPTGSGKTRAALYPFLCGGDPSHEMWGRLPIKCIYSVPMRVLAKQFVHEYSEIVETYNRKFHLDLKVRIQTGEQPQDINFAGNLIFATIDQTLSSFLLNPYSLSRSKANLNAAAVMGSYLVFDEFHLFEPTSTLPTTLHMLQMLNGITPFVLMTATFSADMLHGLAKVLNAVIVPETPEERSGLLTLPSQQKTRRYHLANGVLTAQVVWQHHRTRSLVICNTVDRARKLFEDLTVITKATDTKVHLLHSRFLTEDRNRTEDEIRQWFGKDAPKQGNYIIVSTQAIEVGVDITSENLHTELAPANAIIQRAGRCARYPGDEGDVYIYTRAQDPEKGEIDLLENVNPYRDQNKEFQYTLDAFNKRNGELTFADEQAILSAVHGERDAQLIADLQVSAPEHRRRMYGVMTNNPADDARNLVREIIRQPVTISATPDDLLESPFEAPAFGLHPSTLQGYVKNWLAMKEQFEPEDVPFGVSYLHETPDPDQSNRSVYQWKEVWNNSREIIGAPLVVVHPRLASYHAQLGFLPYSHKDASWEARLPERGQESDTRRETSYRYRLETYETHIRLVYEAAFHYDGSWSELEGAALRLEQRFDLQPGAVREAAELAVLLHDVGKLSEGWQGWVEKYQKAIGKPTQRGEAYAHTDWEKGNKTHEEGEKQAKKRPWHAVEGAIAVTPLLIEAYGEGHPLAQAIFSAIARHHAPYSESTQGFRLRHDSTQHIQNTLRGRQLALDTLVGVNEAFPGGSVASYGVLAEPGKQQNAAFLIYLLLARVLRFADQRGTHEGTLGG